MTWSGCYVWCFVRWRRHPHTACCSSTCPSSTSRPASMPSMLWGTTSTPPSLSTLCPVSRAAGHGTQGLECFHAITSWQSLKICIVHSPPGSAGGGGGDSEIKFTAAVNLEVSKVLSFFKSWSRWECSFTMLCLLPGILLFKFLPLWFIQLHIFVCPLKCKVR